MHIVINKQALPLEEQYQEGVMKKTKEGKDSVRIKINEFYLPIKQSLSEKMQDIETLYDNSADEAGYFKKTIRAVVGRSERSTQGSALIRAVAEQCVNNENEKNIRLVSMMVAACFLVVYCINEEYGASDPANFSPDNEVTKNSFLRNAITEFVYVENNALSAKDCHFLQKGIDELKKFIQNDEEKRFELFSNSLEAMEKTINDKNAVLQSQLENEHFNSNDTQVALKL